MSGIRRLLALVLITTLTVPLAFAQEGAERGAASDPPAAAADPSRAPTPYRREEFPQWAWDLRRAEIVTIGSFPITMILTGFTYELARFAFSEFDQRNAPWFLRTAAGERFNEGERIGMILTAGALSVIIGVVDHLLGRREERRRR